MLSDYEPLVVQLFNMRQGGVDAGMMCNDYFDRVLSTLDVHRSMRDLAVCARVINGELAIVLVSTDDFLVSTKSEPARYKFINHLNQCCPLTTKEVSALQCLNYRIIRSSSYITLD